MKQFDATRIVWADVTGHPQATVREIMDRTGLSSQTVQNALQTLVNVGYISQAPMRGRARRINLPFVYTTTD